MLALFFNHKSQPVVLTKSLYTRNITIFNILLFTQQNIE